MYNVTTVRSQLVEAKITGTPAVGDQYNFSQVNNLDYRQVEVYAIEAFTRSQLAVSEFGSTLITQAAAANLTVTLFEGSNKKIDNMPLLNMVRAVNSGLIWDIQPFTINLTECFIRLNATAGLLVNEAAVFAIHYKYK